MQARKKKSTRKLLLAVPIVSSAITVLQAAASANTDGGQGDAGTDGGAIDSRDHLCSVGGAGSPFGPALGAGCC